MLTIAHLSDSHIGAHPTATERTRLVLDHLKAMDPLPDVVLLTGDLADHGWPDEYRELRPLLDSFIDAPPVLSCPGNHDVASGHAKIPVGGQGLPC